MNEIFAKVDNSYNLKSILFLVGTIITLGLLNLFVESPIEHALMQVEKYLMEQNEKIYNPIGLHFLSPRITALLHVYTT